MRLHHDDPGDPWVFRAELPKYGYNFRVLFNQESEEQGASMRLPTDIFSFKKRLGARNPRRWINAGLLAGATVIAVRRGR